MFHVLGFGSLWPYYGFLVDGGTTNPQYNGSLATLEAYRNAGGTGDLIPLENRGSPQGTRNSHWRTSIFGDELMTGALTGSFQPLSRLNVMALQDLLYIVDADSDEIDPYVIPAAGSVPETDWGECTYRKYLPQSLCFLFLATLLSKYRRSSSRIGMRWICASV